ncbi:MAG: 50S ribosomal protein L4 [Patescibacteria group bacterium]|nr:50S ribosomal protein L4 [Patescibacteria group bacterium]
MAEASVYNKEGKEIEKIELNPKIFGVEINPVLVHEAVVAAMANKRRIYAHTKGRGEVRGGGKKPWRQKGTGRARHGSTRSPIWVGGGITFGPTSERNYSVKINKKVKRKALLMALSAKAGEGQIILIDDLEISSPKTKTLNAMFKKMPGVGKKLLFVLDKPNREIMRAVRNISWVNAIGANNLNLMDVLSYPQILFPKNALPVIEKLYSLK